MKKKLTKVAPSKLPDTESEGAILRPDVMMAVVPKSASLASHRSFTR